MYFKVYTQDLLIIALCSIPNFKESISKGETIGLRIDL